MRTQRRRRGNAHHGAERLERRLALAGDLRGESSPRMPTTMWIERDNGDVTFYDNVVNYATSQQPLQANKLILRLADPASTDSSISGNFQLDITSGLLSALVQLDKKGFVGQVSLLPDFTSNGHAWGWNPAGQAFTAEWQKAFYWADEANQILAAAQVDLRIREITLEAQSSGIPADSDTLTAIRAYQQTLWPGLDSNLAFVGTGLAHGYTNLAQMAAWTVGATAADRLLDAAYCELYNFTETVGTTTYVDAYAAGASVTNPSPAAPDTIYTLARNAADPAATIFGTPTVSDAGSTFGYFVGKHTSPGSGMPQDLSRTTLLFSLEDSSAGQGLIDAFGTWDAPVGQAGAGVDDFIDFCGKFTSSSDTAGFMGYWQATTAPAIGVFEFEYLPSTWTVGLMGSSDVTTTPSLDSFGFTLWDYRECSTDATSLAKYHTWLLTYLAAHPPGKLVLYVTDPAIAQNDFYDPLATPGAGTAASPLNFVGFLKQAAALPTRVPIEILIDRSSFPASESGGTGPTPVPAGWVPLVDATANPIELPGDWVNLPRAFSWLATLVGNAAVPSGVVTGLTIDPEVSQGSTGLTGDNAYEHVACWVDRSKRIVPHMASLDLGMALEVDSTNFAKVNTMAFPVVGTPTNGMPAFIGSWIDEFLDKTDPGKVFPAWRQPGDMGPILSMAYMETYVGGAPNAYSYYRWMNTLSGQNVVPQQPTEAAADLQKSLLDRPYATGDGTITVDKATLVITGAGTNFGQLVQYDAITIPSVSGSLWKVADDPPANPTLHVTGTQIDVTTPSGWEFTELPMNWQSTVVPAGVENRICFVLSAEHDVAGGLPFFGFWQLPDFLQFMSTATSLLATADPANAVFVNAIDGQGTPTVGRGVPQSGYGLYSLKQICDAWGVATYPDCVVPAAPVVELVVDSGSSGTDRVTNDGRLSVQGEPGARIEYSRDGGRTWTTGFTPRPGINAVQVRQIDAADNVSPTSDIVFVLDRQRPVAPVPRLVEDTGRSERDRITNVGRVTAGRLESGAIVQYSLDAGRSWTDGFTAREGVNAVWVRQRDVAGNVSAGTAFRFVLDTQVATPEVMLWHDTGSDGGDGVTRDGRLRIRGIERDAWRQYSVDGGRSWRNGFRATPGFNMVRVRQVDVAGNVSQPAVTQFTFDRS